MKPDYVAQTFDAEHVYDAATARAWFAACGKEAHDEGCTWPQMTVNEDQSGLLFEGWKERPNPQPAPHWQMTLMEGGNHE